MHVVLVLEIFLSFSETLPNPTAGNANDWYIFNLQQSGFYRVNYDTENWNNLINQLNTDHTVSFDTSSKSTIFLFLVA